MSKKKPKSEIEPVPELEASAPKPPDDGEAQTAAEPVPEQKRKRGRPPGSKSRPKAAPGSEDPFMDPEFVKMAALGPLILAGGIGVRFFDVVLPYDPDKVAGIQRTFVQWMDQMQIRIGPGWQYGLMTCVCIAQGIKDAERITPEQKAAVQKAQEEAKAARKAAREQAKPEAKPAASSGANGAATHGELALVPQKPADAPAEA